MAPRACRRPESSRNAETWKAEGVGPSSPRDRVFPGDKGRLASKETLDGGLGGGGGASQSLALRTPCRRGTRSSGLLCCGNPVCMSKRGSESAEQVRGGTCGPGPGRRPARPRRDGQEVANELMLVLSLEN